MEQETGQAILRVRDLDVYYGSIATVRGVSLEVRRREIVCLLGPNGAGKTTVLNAIIGHVKPRAGVIEYRNGEHWIEIQGHPVHERVRMGILSVAAVENVLPRFTVEENLEIGAYARTDKATIQEDLSRQFTRFPILKERRKQFAGTLSGGQQKILAIARALMGRPRLLLLDEPSLGLAGVVRDEVFSMVRNLSREDGWEALLVEQNVKQGLEVSDRAYVMRIGAVDFTAASRELLHSDRIEKAYFGG
jgi:branched-chain amino acid transport system ATP-binding protein